MEEVENARVRVMASNSTSAATAQVAVAIALQSATTCCGLLLGNSLVLLCLLFLKIQNPQLTNLAGSLDGAPIHRNFTDSKTKTLSRDRSILQHFIHTVGIRCFLSIHRLQCDCDCDLRARRAADFRSHNTTPPLRPRRGLIPVGGRLMVAPGEQA